MASSTDFKDQLKQQADIVRVIGEYVRLRKAGAQNWVGLCPFHKEKSPSFSVHETRQFYHCFGCHESGDVFKFLQKVENITFGEAIRELARKLGVPMPKMQYDSPAEQREAALRMKLIDVHERACAWLEQQLRKPDAAHAREYLTGRGMSQEIIAKFRIGFAPESGYLLRDFLRPQFGDDVLAASGLFKESDRPTPGTPSSAHPHEPSSAERIQFYSKFRNRVMFPIMNESGRVIAFTGRTLTTDEKAGPKYLNSPETPIYSKGRVLFNLDKAKDAIRSLEYAILVEGQMDCISVYAAGLQNVIASSGTAFTEAQARLLGRFSRRIVVNFDPDTAGAAAAERSLGLLVEEDFDIKVVSLEAGLDPDLFIRRKGLDEYAAKLRSAPRYFDYLIERARTKFPVRTPDGKVKALNFLLPHIQRVPSRIARDELANDIAQKLAIDSGVLRQELKHAAVARSSAPVKAPTVLASETHVTDAERILIRALASPPSEDGSDPAQYIRQMLTSEPLYEGLPAETLVRALLTSEVVDPGSMELGDRDKRLLATCLMHENEELAPQLLEGALSALRRRTLERRQRQVRAAIADAERRQDATLIATLLREKVEIDRALATAS